MSLDSFPSRGKSKLENQNHSYRCVKCLSQYPISDDIPVFITGDRASDEMSQFWDKGWQHRLEESDQMFDRIIAALEKNDINAAQSALVNEENLNKMQMDFRKSHVQRMSDEACTVESGLIFIDLVDNVEKIGDHLTNIAQAVVGGLQWDGTEPAVDSEAGGK